MKEPGMIIFFNSFDGLHSHAKRIILERKE